MQVASFCNFFLYIEISLTAWEKKQFLVLDLVMLILPNRSKSHVLILEHLEVRLANTLLVHVLVSKPSTSPLHAQILHAHMPGSPAIGEVVAD